MRFSTSSRSWPNSSFARTALGGVVLASLIGITSPAPAQAFPLAGDPAERPFAADSAWNSPIGISVQLDPDSAAMVANLRSETPVADLYEYGTPVFTADASTPRYAINCLMRWGSCALESGTIPIPDEAASAPGSDGQLVVVDTSARKVYEFWRYGDDFATTGWGDVLDLDGEGTGSTAVGSGTSRLGGVVRAYEIAQGRIDHALAFSTDYCEGDVFRYPATKTDGYFYGSGAVPEGARVQLDPTLDVENLPNITPGEIVVAEALQKYGAYNVDCGGASMAIHFENPIGEYDPYPEAGLSPDYMALRHIPWDRMRVLEAWDSSTPMPPVCARCTS